MMVKMYTGTRSFIKEVLNSATSTILSVSNSELSDLLSILGSILSELVDLRIITTFVKSVSRLLKAGLSFAVAPTEAQKHAILNQLKHLT